jgi:hypothetical protein
LKFRLRGPSQILKKLKIKTISDVRQSQGGNKRRKLRGKLEDGSPQPSLYLLYMTADHRDHMGAQLCFIISGFPFG